LTDGVNPSGPVFISYRWSDGSGHALDLARRLRASGVPAWLDRQDLPPGETETRLKEALAAGLSGAVLVATQDIEPRKTNDPIHDIEVPALVEMAKDTRFTLAVLGTIPRADRADGVDRDRTAEMYRRPELKGMQHYSQIDGTLDSIGPAFARQRLGVLRAGRTDALSIDIQTRRSSLAFASDSDLVFRSVPPVESRVPAPAVWKDLRQFLAWLPAVVADHQPSEVALEGGAHLTVAFAFGAAFSEPAGTRLCVRATDAAVWRPTPQRLSWIERLPLLGTAPAVRRAWRGDGTALAVFVDLVPTKPPSTFEQYLDAHRYDFKTGVVIDLNRHLGSDDGPRFTAEVARLLLSLASPHDGAVHLFLRAPWAAVALLGASLNTLQVTLYEWENSVSPPHYIKTITATAGVGGGPITAIHVT
jgi:hypothetical protein